MTKISNTFFLYAGFVAVLTLVLTNIHNCFFWDTVQLGSAHATYYLSNNFSNLILPVDFDSGHIPTFGLYIALVWKIFGRNLEASHLAMLPFALGIVWQLYRLCQKIIRPEFAGIAMLMILADPSLLAQITLVSPDIPLALFFLMGINAVLENRKKWLLLAVLLLFLTSMRGMMVSLCLLGLDLYCNVGFRKNTKEIFISLIRRSVIYIPGFVAFLCYNSYHFYKTGWIGYHKDSPWAECFEPVGIGGFFYNIGTLGFRLLDFGRVGIWLTLLILIAVYRKKLLENAQTKMLLFFGLLMLVLFPANMLWAKNLLGHRYLIPVFLVIALLCAHILFSDYVSKKLRIGLSVLWIVVLLSGNFWIYPDKIAKGWDATLAHLPFYKLRTEAIAYLNRENIDLGEVKSFFPNAVSFNYIDLNNDPRQFGNFDGTNEYVFYSNIFNIPDTDYDLIMTKYKLLKRFDNRGIYVGIYKKLP